MARQLLKREDRRESVLRAAATAFARAGYGGTLMTDVAAEAGVSKVIVYRHVDSKDELYRRVLERVSSRMNEIWEELSTAGRARPVVAHLRVAREDPDGYRLLFSHAAREPDFVAYAFEVRTRSERLADLAFGARFDPGLRLWAVRTYVDHLVDAVLRWLDDGEPDDDDLFVMRATAGLDALRRAWSAPLVGARQPEAVST